MTLDRSVFKQKSTQKKWKKEMPTISEQVRGYETRVESLILGCAAVASQKGLVAWLSA
jgi:hypothetical protein